MWGAAILVLLGSNAGRSKHYTFQAVHWYQLHICSNVLMLPRICVFDAFFVRNSVNHIFKHSVGFPTIDGICSPWICIRMRRQFLNTSFSFFGLNTCLGNAGRTHLACIWVVVATASEAFDWVAGLLGSKMFRLLIDKMVRPQDV